MFSLGLTGDRKEDVKSVLRYLECLLPEKKDAMEGISFLSNAAALLGWYMADINWTGFYLAKGDTLHLGPFQGEPACTSIHFSRGVCGLAARERRSVVVDDVLSFPGHIACSASSRSEIVVPLIWEGRLWGVLDTDSPKVSRFTEEDRVFLEKAGSVISKIAPAFSSLD